MPTVNEVLQRGWQIHQSGDVHQAESIYRHVLAHSPRNSDAFVYLGIALFDQRRFVESIESYREAIAIRNHFPIAWNNLGNSLRMTGEFDEAEMALATALQQQPDYLSALKNRGTLWVWNGEIERGLKWYDEGLKVAPDNAELHRNLGVIHLLLGNYDKGWSEYRWRWKMPGTYRPSTTIPVWQGEEINGRSILLYPEQGRGDAIQFIRVARTLKQAGATVFVQCAPELIPLFSSAPGIEMLLPIGSVVPPVDYHASLIDVVDCWYQQHRCLPTEGDAFSTGNGYLSVGNSLTESWQHWFETHCDSGQRIGINWQGNPEHHADVYRSIALSELKPLASIPNAQLISLQFGYGIEQIPQCDFRDKITVLPESIDVNNGAFVDTAAILQNLDCLVTTDTAVAHLAGAVGVKTFLMLNKVPDWRWLNEGVSTPWYPSVKLIRQRQIGNWNVVVEEICESISAMDNP